MSFFNIFGDVVEYLSKHLRADAAAIRLLFALLIAYPVVIFYRKHIYGRSPNIQHIYFTTLTLFLGYLNFGWDLLHPLGGILATYLVLLVLGGTALSVAIVFIGNLTYLLVGYYSTSTDQYDIKWTMPYCLLTLRLISVAFDYYDGQMPYEKLGEENKKSALKELPPFLEYMAYNCFPVTFFVGPVFPIKRYRNYVEGKFGDDNDPQKPPKSEYDALKRFGLGILYLTMFQILGFYVSDKLMSSWYLRRYNFVNRMLIMGIWGKFTLYKYISCWLLAEGSCILLGISFNGKDENGKPKWDGLRNVNLSVLENTKEFDDYIHSFNINTNKWVAQYVFKRLKFLGNKLLSQLLSLFFLAAWHGTHSGYYVCFFFEFLIIYMERDVKKMVSSNERVMSILNTSAMKVILNLLLRLYTVVFMGFCLIPFVMFKFEKYWYVFGSVNYSGLLLWGAYPLIWRPLLRVIFKQRKRNENNAVKAD